ncbi:MAG: PIG-L family deacetylase [Verrucomicrobiota bacterium]
MRTETGRPCFRAPSFSLSSILNGGEGRGEEALNCLLRKSSLAKSLLVVSLVISLAACSHAETVSPAEILHELKNFRECGRVLYVAAHPDDENTQLITYLARGRHYRTAYLSITRGDGGQNVIGPEFDEQLGVIRTQELLAARRLDGGEQFFTRAIDFGYSKDYRETLRIWNHQEVLSDVVRVVRTFQPDVIVAGFSTNQTPGQHGHHVASAVLASEAFKLAGDTNSFPDQLTSLKPWQPKRLLQNVRFGGRSGGGALATDLRIDASGTDPVLGMSYAEIAGRSRAMHKSQGFDNFRIGGGNGLQYQSFQFLDGEPATNDIMDGVDTTWNRFPGGAEIAKQVDEIVAKFDTNNPAASVEALLMVQKNLAALPEVPVWNKQRFFDKILQHCLGLSVLITTSKGEVAPNETYNVRTVVRITSKFPVTWLKSPESKLNSTMESTDDHSGNSAPLPLSQPVWLDEEPSGAMYRLNDLQLIGRPAELLYNEDFHQFPKFRIGEANGPTITFPVALIQAGTESNKFEQRRPLHVVAPVSLRCANQVELFAPGATKEVRVEVKAARANMKGELSLNAPADWKISPAQPFNLAAAGETKTFTFKVTAPAKITSAQFTAQAKIGDKVYNNQRIEISYPHIPAQILQPLARIKAVTLDLVTRGKKVGYVPGAGDSVADALKQMGYEITTLAGSDLTTNRLKEFDAVVIGIRAFNVRNDLAPHLSDLFAFAETGGNVIVQYNRPNDLKTDRLAPYSLRLSGDRVTDENAPMKFLVPEHPALNTPNKITAADFDGWVQERGIYFPNQWDEHFTPLLACADPGEEPKSGALLVAQHGKGWFVYTGLVFFRELPAGVPGAYRLLANLVSLGK